jgi:hypothetical protein
MKEFTTMVLEIWVKCTLGAIILTMLVGTLVSCRGTQYNNSLVSGRPGIRPKQSDIRRAMEASDWRYGQYEYKSIMYITNK